MKKRLIIISVLLLTFCLSGLAIFFFSNSKNHSHELILYGNVDVRQVDIGFRVAGQVDRLFFEEGDLVSKGTLMATLDRTPYDSQVKQASANVESIKVSLMNAEKLLKRRQELIKVGGVSQEDLDNSQASHDELRANLRAAQSALTVAIDNLSYTEAYAPTEGIILTRIREPGTVVNPTDPVYTLSVTSPVWIRAFVAEPQLGLIAYGMKAEVITDTKGGPIYKGKIGFISPVSEFTPKTVETTQLRTDLVYRLRIYVDNPDQYLKQGMPVTVRIKTLEQEKEDR